MINDILNLLDGDWTPAGTVSGGDAPAGDDVSGMGFVDGGAAPDGDMPGAGSVSGGDAGGGAMNYYQVNLYAVPDETAAEASPEPQEVQYTLWDKPLEEYSVTEGLLLVLAVAAVAVLAWNVIKGGFKWLT